MRATHVLPALLLSATCSHAVEFEGHADLYGTNLDSATATLHLEERFLLGGSNTADANIDAGASPEAGVRLLMGAKDRPWLVGIELGGFSTNSPSLSLDAMQIAVTAGVRTPRPLLARHGHGLRPYLLAGITAASFDGWAETGGIRVPLNYSSGFLSSGASETAPLLAAGLEWQLSPRFGVVAEYRWRKYDLEGFGTDSWIFPTSNTYADGKLDASGIALGVSWWFAGPRASTADATMPPPAAP